MFNFLYGLFMVILGLICLSLLPVFFPFIIIGLIIWGLYEIGKELRKKA